MRYIGEGGAERGLAVLEGLELGSNWSLDLNTYFLQNGSRMFQDYGVMEFSLIGSQPPPPFMVVPFRYGKEDGSDGVVRVSASNLNFNYIQIGPAMPPSGVAWDEAETFAQKATAASTRGDLADFTKDPVFAGGYYAMKGVSWSDGGGPAVPFAIPYRCAHVTDTMGIVYGDIPHSEILTLLSLALTATPDNYRARGPVFAAVTEDTYAQAADPGHSEGLLGLLGTVAADAKRVFSDPKQAVNNYLLNPQGQYDPHAQIIFRVRDQNGRPINDCSIHFNSFGGGVKPKILINKLFEDSHVNKPSPDTTVFYLRLQAWDPDQKTWVNRLPDVNGVDLEIDSIDALTNEIVFLPLRMRLPVPELERYLQPHQTTVIDIQLMRLPSRKTFSLYPNP